MKRLFTLCASAVIASLIASTPASAQNVEVQLNICDDIKHVLKALNVRDEGQNRDVFYFETEGMNLFQNGVVVRLRLEDKKIKLTVKMELFSAAVFRELMKDPENDCEIDLHGTTRKMSCKFDYKLDNRAYHQLITGQARLSQFIGPRALTSLQRYTRAYEYLDQTLLLETKGGYYWKLALPQESEPLDIEYRVLGKDYVQAEISNRVPLGYEASRQAGLTAWMQQLGIKMCPSQDARTGDALHYLLTHGQGRRL